MNVGNYIKQLRIEKGISQAELGKVVGVQRAAVQKWECGITQNLKRDTIKKLAEFFDVDPSSFIFDDYQQEIKFPVEKEKPDEAGLDENIIIYHRNGKIIKKKMSKEKMELLSSMLDALPDDDNPDL